MRSYKITFGGLCWQYLVLYIIERHQELGSRRLTTQLQWSHSLENWIALGTVSPDGQAFYSLKIAPKQFECLDVGMR